MRPLQLAHSMRWPPVPGAWWSHCLGANSRCLGVRSRSPRNLYLHHCKMYNCTQMLVQRIHPNVWKSVLEFSLPFASSSPTVSCSKQPHGIGRLHRWPRSHKSAAPFRLRHAAHGPRRRPELAVCTGKHWCNWCNIYWYAQTDASNHLCLRVLSTTMKL